MSVFLFLVKCLVSLKKTTIWLVGLSSEDVDFVLCQFGVIRFHSSAPPHSVFIFIYLQVLVI